MRQGNYLSRLPVVKSSQVIQEQPYSEKFQMGSSSVDLVPILAPQPLRLVQEQRRDSGMDENLVKLLQIFRRQTQFHVPKGLVFFAMFIVIGRMRT